MEKIRQVLRLHQIQSDFHKSQAIYRGFIGGRNSGKTYGGILDLLRRAKRGRTYMVASPTGLMMNDNTFPKTKKVAQELGIWPDPNDKSRLRLSPYPTATLSTGATVRFRSADNPDSMRGPDLSGVWLDEGSQMEEEVFKICIGCLRECGEQGWLTCTTTPMGMNHWTYEQFGTDQPHTAIFKARTDQNPFSPPGFAATLATKYAGQWARQELGGEFVSMEGALFDAAWFHDGIWFDNWPHPSEILLTIIALDPSMGKDARGPVDGRLGDYSAFAIIKLHKDGTIYVDCDMDNRRNTVQIVKDGFRLYDMHSIGHPVDAFAVEVNLYQQLLAKDFLREAAACKPFKILPMWGWANLVKKEVRILRLAPMLAGIDGRMRFKRNSSGAKLLVGQLLDFRFPPHKAGYHDDGCFVAGTMIETADGPKPIESIQVGDLALTRKGYARVLASGCTGVKNVMEVRGANGKSLVGTENHPIFNGIAYIPMRCACTMYSCHENTMQRNPSPLFSTGLPSAAIPKQNNGLTGSISRLTHPTDEPGSERTIRNFGNRSMDQFQVDTKSTMPTAILSTMSLATWSALPKPNTTAATVRNEAGEPRSANPRLTPLLNGMRPKLAENGIANMASELQPLKSRSRSSASIAEFLVRRSHPTVSSSARLAAGSDLTPPMVDMLAVSVIGRNEAGVAPVYNLTVAGESEYFANGFLVHNCDALEMAVRMLLHLMGGGKPNEAGAPIPMG